MVHTPIAASLTPHLGKSDNQFVKTEPNRKY